MSGGERQRLSIARVALHRPKLLILGSRANSAPDSANKRYVQAALEPLMKGRTTVAIAHRPSTIMPADVIFVLHHGTIVEQFDGSNIECRYEDGVVFKGGKIAFTVDQRLGSVR